MEPLNLVWCTFFVFPPAWRPSTIPTSLSFRSAAVHGVWIRGIQETGSGPESSQTAPGKWGFSAEVHGGVRQAVRYPVNLLKLSGNADQSASSQAHCFLQFPRGLWPTALNLAQLPTVTAMHSFSLQPLIKSLVCARPQGDG